MTMYWIYNLPNWLLGVGTVATFLVGSIGGFYLSRPLTRRILASSGRHNDVVSYVFAAVGVLYGLALGLIAVATWDNFTGVDDLVGKEAADIVALYRDLDGYPNPLRQTLEGQLRDYTRFIIDKEWPEHRRGLVLDDGDRLLESIENAIMAFEPRTEAQKIMHAEVIDSLEGVVEQRRMRLQAVTTALPAALWSVVIVGAVLNISLAYFFWVENQALHVVLIGSFASSLALLIFLMAAMDNPFRGEFSVSPDAYEMVYQQVMTSRRSAAP